MIPSLLTIFEVMLFVFTLCIAFSIVYVVSDKLDPNLGFMDGSFPYKRIKSFAIGVILGLSILMIMLWCFAMLVFTFEIVS
jgi:uncharacterized membrane protein